VLARKGRRRLAEALRLRNAGVGFARGAGEIRADLRYAQFLLGYLQVRRFRDDNSLVYRWLMVGGRNEFRPYNVGGNV
jgi:hypothetical protein